MALWFFLVTSLFTLSIAKSPELQYVMIVPSVVHGNLSNEACVHLHNLNESVFVNVTLEYNTEGYLLWEGIARTSHFSQCFSCMVPSAASNPLAFLVLSVKGSSISIYERRSVAVRNISTTLFIQTDKSTYKRGQTVKFRVLTLDSDFRPVNKLYPLVYIQDPQGNRIVQWLNQTSSSGLLEFEFHIFEDTNLGSYQITVQDDDKPNYGSSQWFSVENYVLPKFEVNLKAPERVSPYDENFEVMACSWYTYGQPVQGNIQLRVCRNRYYHPRCDKDSNGICEDINAKLGKDGCVSVIISTKAFRLYANPSGSRFSYASLNLEGIVTENGTGIQSSSTSFISVYHASETVMFEQVDPFYKRGLPLTGQIKLNDEDSKPIAGGLIFLEFDGEIVANYTTDKNGIALFSIKTSELFQPTYKLRAFYQSDHCTDYGWLETSQPETIHTVQRFFSRSDSFVKIEPVLEELPCGQQKQIIVHYIISKEHYKDMQTIQVHFHHIVIAQGKIINGGTQQVKTRPGQHGTFSITLNVEQKLAPRAKLLVYSLQPHCDLIAESIFLPVEKCFRNKVGLQFSDKKVLPASNVGLFLEASSNSICALSGVDKSVLLLRPGTQLSPEYVFSRMPYLDLWGYYFMGTNLEDDPKEPCIEVQDTFFKGLYHVPVNVTNDGDVFDILENLGIKAFTKCTLRKPVVCRGDHKCKKISSDDSPYPLPEATTSRIQGKALDSENSVIETIRKDFPETWLWNLVMVDSSGKANLSYTVPDTITEWDVSAFCVQDRDGFGISKTVFLIGFQEFFVDSRFPYSMIRGEEAPLIVNVFNYLDKCIEITVSLEESADFIAEKVSPEDNVTRICANETIAYIWRINPKKLGTVNFTVTAEAKAGESTVGRRDTIIQSLLVEPEGIKKEVTRSSLICVKGTTASENLTMALPANLVEGSDRALFVVLGDILGPALKLTENFLEMPYGCGEQNIAIFLSNLVIWNYLKNTKQLTEEKKSKIIGHLTSGYQKQLFYRLFDGSFSTFGSRDANGNLWLTATVVRAFGQAKDVVYIDDKVLNQALIWIARKQEADGCFKPSGTIYNNAVKDGEDYTVIMTAFVVSCLLESGFSQATPIVKTALSCLDATSNGAFESPFENSLLAYTYSLAHRVDKLEPILDTLFKTATRVGGHIYWEREKRPQAEKYPSFYSRAPSAEIQMTSYVLIAYLRQTNLSRENMVIASQIVRWIVKQQNSNGGFSASQDTFVALQALADFGKLTFVKDAQNTVAITGAEGSFKKMFPVDESNTLLLQQTPLPRAQGNYSVEVNGSGCIYTQTIQRYNIILPTQASGFALAVDIRNPNCAGKVPPRFEIFVRARYNGERNTSNMAIVDIKLLSGYAPDQYSLQQLSDKVMRVEQKNDHIFIYLSEVSANETTFFFTLVQTHPVSHIKPRDMWIYDYYETDEFARTEYNTPCP